LRPVADISVDSREGLAPQGNTRKRVSDHSLQRQEKDIGFKAKAGQANLTGFRKYLNSLDERRSSRI
jgi:hypothetical protein